LIFHDNKFNASGVLSAAYHLVYQVMKLNNLIQGGPKVGMNYIV